MIVGNGFHEVRGQSDSRMVEIFRAYEDASFLLLFTEESARAVDDLLQTGWNTYTPVSNTCTSDRGRACVRWRFPPFGAGRGPACQLDGMRDAGLVLPGSDDLPLHAAQRPQPVHLGEPLLRTGAHRQAAGTEQLRPQARRPSPQVCHVNEKVAPRSPRATAAPSAPARRRRAWPPGLVRPRLAQASGTPKQSRLSGSTRRHGQPPTR